MARYAYSYKPGESGTILPESVKLAEDGTLSFVIDCPIGDATSQVVFDRDYSKAAAAVIGIGAGWPIVSDALGIHPDEVARIGRELHEHGVTTQFTSEGQPIFENREHRRRYMKQVGAFDRSGGYGDATP